MRKISVTIIASALFSCAHLMAAPPPELTEVRSAQLAEIRQQIKEITPAQLVEMTENNTPFVLLDVREPNEHGIFINAQNMKKIPRGLIEWRAAKELDAEDTIVVYCRTGARGAYATKRLQELGYKNIVNLKGGIVGWLEAGYPIETYVGEIQPKEYKLPEK